MWFEPRYHGWKAKVLTIWSNADAKKWSSYKYMYSRTSAWLVVKVCVISSDLQHGLRLWILCLTFIYDNCKRSWLRVEVNVLFWPLLVSGCTQIKGHNKYLFNYIRHSGFEIRFSLAWHLSHWTWPMRETCVAVNVINGILGSRENWA